MSPVIATMTAPPMAVVYSRPSLITMNVTRGPTSVGSAPLGEHDVVLPPQLIQRDTMMGSVGLATQQQPQSQMPSQDIPVVPWVLLR